VLDVSGGGGERDVGSEGREERGWEIDMM